MKHFSPCKGLFFIALATLIALASSCGAEKKDQKSLLALAGGGGSGEILIPGPTSIEATKGTHTDKIGINWSLVENADQYIIYRSDSPEGTFEEIASVEAPTAPAPEQTPAPAPEPTPAPAPAPAQPVNISYVSNVNLNPWGMFGVGVFIAAWQTPKIKISVGTSINAVVEFPGGILGTYWDQQEVINKINAAVGINLCVAHNANGKYYLKMDYQGEPIIMQNQFSNDVEKLFALYCPLGSFIKSGVTKDQVIIVNANGTQVVNKNQYTGNPADYITVVNDGGGDTGGDTGGNTEPTVNYFFTDTNITQGTHYYYKIKAIVNEKETDFSQTDEGFAKVGGAPNAPTNVSASDGTAENKIVVTWTAATGASYYKVYRADPYTSILKLVPGAENVTGTSFEDTASLPGICRYKVVGFGPNGEEGLHSATDNGYRSVMTAVEFIKESLKTVARSQKKMPHMGGLGTDDPVNGDVSGRARYNAVMQGLGASVDIDYYSYCDYYMIMSGNIHTSANMSSNGTNTGKIIITGIYSGYIKNDLVITGGAPSSGTYKVYLGPAPDTDHVDQEQTVDLSQVQ